MAYVAESLYQALIIFYVSYGVYRDQQENDLWGLGLVQLFGCVIVVNLQLLADAYYVTISLLIALAYVAVLFCVLWLRVPEALRRHFLRRYCCLGSHHLMRSS